MLSAICSQKWRRKTPLWEILDVVDSQQLHFINLSFYHLKFSPRLEWLEWPSSEARRRKVSRSASRRRRPWKASGHKSSCSLESKYDWNSLNQKIITETHSPWLTSCFIKRSKRAAEQLANPSGQDVFSPCCRPLTVTKLESCIPPRPRRISQAQDKSMQI